MKEESAIDLLEKFQSLEDKEKINLLMGALHKSVNNSTAMYNWLLFNEMGYIRTDNGWLKKNDQSSN